MAASGRGSFSRGLGLGAVTFGAVGLLSLISTVLTARVYGIDVVGQFALAYAPTGAVVILSTVREQPAMVRALNGYEPGDRGITGIFYAVFAFSQVLTLVFVGLGAMVTVLVFTGPLDHTDLVAPAVVSLVGYLMINNVNWNLDTIFATFRASDELLAVRLSQAVSYIAVTVTLGVFAQSVWGIVIGTLVSWGLSLCHRILLVRGLMALRVSRTEFRTGMRELPEIIRFGLRITPGFLGIGASNECGAWVLGSVSSISAVGAFNRCWGMSQRLVELNFRITEILFPTLVERRTAGNRAGFDVALMDSLRYAAAAMALPAAVAGGAGEGLLSLFGSSFEGYSAGLAWILVVPGLMTASSIQAHASFALERTRATVLLALLRFGATLGLGIPLAARHGFTGMAIAMVVGAAIQLVGQTMITVRQLESPFTDIWPLRHVGALVAAYVSAFLVSHELYAWAGGLVWFPVVMLGGAAVYFLVLAGLGGLLPRDRARLTRAVTVLRGRSATA
jgi:O-antigen/teichoic acid export membrane protein